MSIVQFGLLLAVAMPFILAGRMAFMRWQPAEASSCSNPEIAGFDPGGSERSTEPVDVDAALREIAAAAIQVARPRWVRIDLALEAAMTLPLDPGVLKVAVRDTISAAIHAAPGGQVLVAAVILGSQLHIRVTDDGAGVDQRLREAAMRQTQALIAMQGGSVAVEARPGRGTTVTIRLPLPASEVEDVSDAAQLRILADQPA